MFRLEPGCLARDQTPAALLSEGHGPPVHDAVSFFSDKKHVCLHECCGVIQSNGGVFFRGREGVHLDCCGRYKGGAWAMPSRSSVVGVRKDCFFTLGGGRERQAALLSIRSVYLYDGWSLGRSCVPRPTAHTRNQLQVPSCRQQF